MKRQVPNSLMYRAHLVAKGAIPTESPGGLYTRLFLQEYFFTEELPFSVSQYLTQQKSWHGEPLAALRRCIHILGSMRCNIIDKDIRRKLERLRNLYFFDDGEVDKENHPDPSLTQSEGIKPSTKRSLDDAEPSSNPPKPKRTRQNRQDQREGGGQIEYCPVSQGYQWFSWNLGPQITTEEVVQRYAPIILESSEI